VLSLKVNELIEEQFRYTLGSVRGTHKGNLKFALEEAMYFWVLYYEEKYGRNYDSDIMKKELDKMRVTKEDRPVSPEDLGLKPEKRTSKLGKTKEQR
jgi:hypothetical protein